MKNKHILITLLATALLFGSTACHKDAQIEPKTPKVTEPDVSFTATTANFSWAVSFPGKVSSVVKMSRNADMSDATSYGDATPTSNKDFFVAITGLSPETQYYYCFEIWNPNLNHRSEVKSFTTQPKQKPMVTTASVSQLNFTNATAVGGGEVTSDGGDAVTERGIYFGTSPNPATIGTKIVASSAGTGSFTCIMTGLVSGTYYVCAYATNGQGTNYGDVKNFEYNYYVDLGLPSGLLWATCNVGADNPEDYGDYFAWGETQTKDVYNWSTYQYCNGSYNTLTKYCDGSSYGYNGFTDNLTTLQPSDDAATANWGDGWRMPTLAEWNELLNNTTNTWTTQNSVNGRLFTASNGNSLFLPAAGSRDNSSLSNAGSRGAYWSSSLKDYPDYAWGLYFGSGNCSMYDQYGNSRYYGRSVRPVRSSGQN